MKIITLFLLCFVFCLSAGNLHSQNTKLSLDKNHVQLEQIINEIEKQSDYLFVYTKDVDIKKEYSVNVKKNEIKETLDKLFAKTGVNYEIEGNYIILSRSKKDTPEKLSNQQNSKRVTGTVMDDTDEPVIGANVIEKGTTNGVITDINGKFTLQVNDNAVLQISFLGYVTQEIRTGNRSDFSITLQSDSKALEEVIVIGYGTVKKSDLTGSVSSLSSEKITQVNAISNVAQALQGQSAGVMANQRSGQPGEAIMIRVRGANSIGASNEPLYVIDGMLLDKLSSQLNPDDIQNIEVLKDASATAIYGSRGANGVVMITTKRGSEGKATVNYNGYFGVQNLRKKLDLINAHEFATLQNEVAVNDGDPLPWTQAEINALGKGTDWQDEVYQSGIVQNHDLSVAGGSTNTKYYTSFGYFNQEGIIRNSGFERLSYRINVHQKISKKIDFATSLAIQHAKYNQAVYTGADGGGGIPFTTMVMPATQGVYNEDGTYTRFTGVSWGETNPVGISKEVFNQENTTRITGNVRISYEITNGLTFRVSAGVDQYSTKNDYYAPSIITIGQSTQGNGLARKEYSNGLSFLNENLLNYTKSIDKHNIDLLGGITYQYNKSEFLKSGDARGFISDLYENNNIGAAEVKAQPSTEFIDSKLTSYLGRINYNYDGKYYVTLTGRYDGSSKFGENNKYAFFPSGALAWRVSQESFMQNVKAISNLKLRASYGTSGNQAIKPYETLAKLTNRNLYFGGQYYIGFEQDKLENKDLKWETTAQFDIGFDLSLFDDRIQFVADYYQKKTTDLLMNVKLPTSSGFTSIIQNVGSTRNRGWELQITSRNIDNELKWTSTLTLSQNKTEVLDLGKDVAGNPIKYMETGTGGNWFPIIVGESMRQLYGYTVTGIYQTNEEAVQNGEPTKRAGDYKFKNFDGKGNVDDSDKRVLSHLEPNLMFGLNNTFDYKNFDLSILLVGTQGNDVVNEFRKYNLTVNGKWTPTREAFNNRWQGSGTSNKIDKPSKNSGSAIRDYANSLWVEDGSYLRVRDITLGYTFPSNLIRFASSIRIYMSAQNLFTLTNYSGYDPEAVWNANTEINGWDRGVYPSTKSFTGGLKITF